MHYFNTLLGILLKTEKKSHLQSQRQNPLYMESKEKKKVQINLYTEKTQTHRLRKQTYGYQRGR